MSEIVIDQKDALLIARSFNLAFNNAFMYGGSHQTTKDSAQAFFEVLQPMLAGVGIVTISAEKGSVYVENHCVDRVVSVPRITARFKKADVQSISFDSELSPEAMAALFYVLGSLTEFQNVEAMQAYFINERISGIRINYVIYQKVTVDDAVVNRGILSDSQLQLSKQQGSGSESYVKAESGTILRQLSELLTLHASMNQDASSGSGGPAASRLSQADYSNYISKQIKSINSQLDAADGISDGSAMSSAEMLEAIYKVKENVIEDIRLQKEAGKLAALDELAITEINMMSYKVIVRLIREEYRNDRNISVKRLAQIIRRMLPDIKELKYLLPQLKDGLFAEGMTPAEYLALVKELSKELNSDELIQVLVEASDQIGLSVNELIEGVKEAPEEAARLIVLAAEIKKGGVRADDQQMSEVLSDYIEKVSRALALHSPEAALPDGGVMLKSVVTRIEREILDRLKTQNLTQDTVSAVASKLAGQFADTVATLKGDWLRTRLSGPKKPSEEALLSIIEQVAELGHGGATAEIRSVLLANGIQAEAIDAIVSRAQQRAVAAITHALEIPPGVFDTRNTLYFIEREIKLNLRYNTPFSAMLVSYEKVVDLRTFDLIDVTPDITIQITNQALKLLKVLQKRDVDIIGVFAADGISLPIMIFPMTESTGAHFVKKRIDIDFPCHEFVVNGITVHVEPMVTVSGFNRKITADRTAFLELLYQNNCQPKLLAN